MAHKNVKGLFEIKIPVAVNDVLYCPEARSKVRTLKYRIRTEIIRFYLRKSNSISFSFLLMLLL